jgi:hypothetical protein
VGHGTALLAPCIGAIGFAGWSLIARPFPLRPTGAAELGSPRVVHRQLAPAAAVNKMMAIAAIRRRFTGVVTVCIFSLPC